MKSTGKASGSEMGQHGLLASAGNAHICLSPQAQDPLRIFLLQNMSITHAHGNKSPSHLLFGTVQQPLESLPWNLLEEVNF